MGTWANQPMSNMSASSEAWRCSALLGSSGSFQLNFSFLSIFIKSSLRNHYKTMRHNLFNIHSAQHHSVTTHYASDMTNKRVQQLSFDKKSQDILVMLVLIFIFAASSVVTMREIMIYCTWFFHCDVFIMPDTEGNPNFAALFWKRVSGNRKHLMRSLLILHTLGLK